MPTTHRHFSRVDGIPYRAVFPGVIFLYQSFRQKAKLLLTLVRQLSILTLRAGNTPRNSAYGQRAGGSTGEQAAGRYGADEQARNPRANALSNERERGPHRRLEQIRPQAYRSLKIERDEAPDPDVKHIAGEATGTRAERYTVGTIG